MPAGEPGVSRTFQRQLEAYANSESRPVYRITGILAFLFTNRLRSFHARSLSLPQIARKFARIFGVSGPLSTSDTAIRGIVSAAVIVPILVVAAAFPAATENARPKAPLTVEQIIGADKTSTASVVRAANYSEVSRPTAASLQLLKSGLDAVSKNDYPTARAISNKLARGSLDYRLLSWVIALSGNEDVTSAEIAAAAHLTAGWPGADKLRDNSEQALARENPPASGVLAAFGDTQPQTADGIIVLARAFVSSGQPKSASAILVPFWRTAKMDAKDETTIIREFGKLIPQSAHRYRMERMHYENRVRSAQRVASLAGATSLYNAWAAVSRNQKNAGALLDAVPGSQRSAGYVFAKARHLRRRDRFRDAAAVMINARFNQSELIDPAEWWFERRVLSRELLDQGDAKLAYQVAATHKAQAPADIADAEFHAGWFALRALNDAKTSAMHFARVVEVAEGAISNARGYYWLGRAAEAGGPGKSQTYYEMAARYPTAFYGQVAAAKLGRQTLPISYPRPSSADRTKFEKYISVQAIQRLEAADHGSRANRFYIDLAGKLNDAGELALLAVMAERAGNHHMALKVGKIAAARGIDVGALAHPLGAIPPDAKIDGQRKALAYAIARQESEFNAGAVSGAGARGLLQLLPGTAKQMARKTGLRYARAKLTTDSAYNATLGSAYLGEQLERFNGSYVLTFAGYNAGPRRAAEWAERYGDPRGKSLETVVDWIERIPFTETRNYVQRVMENYQVYQVRITDRLAISKDLRQ